MHQPAAPLWAARPPFMLSPATRNLQPSAFLQPSPTRCRPDQSASSSANIPPRNLRPREAALFSKSYGDSSTQKPWKGRQEVQPVIRLRNRQRSASEHIFCLQLRRAQRPTRRSSPAPLFFATPLNNKYSTPRPVPSTPVSTDRAISLSEYRRADNCKVATAGDAPPPSAPR